MHGTLPTNNKLVIHRGASGGMTLTFTDPAGDPVDLSGRTFTAQVKRARDTDVELDMTVTPTDLAGGVIDLTWTAAQTADMTIGPATWGVIDDADFLWIEDTCTITTKTPTNP